MNSSLSVIPEIVSVTLRQLLGRRRAILLLLLATVPILLAILFRLADVHRIGAFTAGIMDAVALTMLLLRMVRAAHRPGSRPDRARVDVLPGH